MLASLFLRKQLKEGHVTLVAVTQLVLGYGYTILVLVHQGTILSPVSLAFLGLVVEAGILFDRKGILFASAAGILAVLGVVLAESLGLIQAPDSNGSIFQWITFALGLAAIGGLLIYSYDVTSQAFQQLHSEVSERERIANDLRKLSQAVEQSPTSIVITDLQGTITYVNPRFTQVTGYSFEEAVGKNPRILKTGLTPKNTHESMWATLKAGKEWRGEFVNRKRDGTIYYESATIAPIASPAGVITHYVAVKEDITERKRLESELRITDLRMRSLFEQTHDAVFIMDLAGRFLDANLHALEILGYERAEIFQLSLIDISAEPEKTTLVISRLVAGEIIPLYERRFRKKSGQVFPGEVNIELVKDEGKEPLHIQCNIRDISRRKQAEDALNNANELLRQRVAEVEALHEEVREQSLHDPLTGLYNRRYLADTLNREVTRAENDHAEVSLILADIDFFKVINDTYGHAVGDQFLVEISRNLTNCARKSDFICRFGGEEFLLILPSTGREAALKRAEQMRQHCAKIALPYEGQNLHVTVSFGVATYPRHAATAEELIVRADKALYLSKHAGRNRVTTSDEVKVAQNDQASETEAIG